MTSKHTIPQKIVSGGQTGVDRAALDAAIKLGIEHGGWCPRGRMAEDGWISEEYNLRETDSGNYAQRTEQNVLDSDGTLIFHHAKLSGGTLLTANLARRHDRPLLSVDLDEYPSEDPQSIRQIVEEWLWTNNIKTMNVAGPRESLSPGIRQEVFELMTRIFAEDS